MLGLKQNPYGLSRRDKVEMDKILDPLAAAQKIEPVPLGQPSAAASPAFIVWNKGKPRVVVDLRKVNAKLYPDAYPLPKQDDVLGALGGAVIFTSLDIQKSFFQQRSVRRTGGKPLPSTNSLSYALSASSDNHEGRIVASKHHYNDDNSTESQDG